MELLLPFEVSPSPLKISYTDKILFIGSCFTEEIGRRMKDLKFNVLQNPNGILYDPISISSALNAYMDHKIYEENDLFQLDELWHSWHHHSVFSGLNKEKVLQNINDSQSNAHQYLKKASWLIITAGTSFKYYLKQSGEPVANCHKAPSSFFQKKLLSTELIISELSAVISKLASFNPHLKIIFTVSPVRHVKDGVIENNLSKARLIELVHFMKENFENVFYFPAYELIIDILRDYRFYKDDYVHPTETATSFVFEKFCNSYIDDAANKLLQEIKTIISAMQHKPFHEESTLHKKFRNSLHEKIKKLERQFPSVDFSNEIKFFS